MSLVAGILIEAMASKGQHAHDLASVICGLVVNGAKLGELEDKPFLNSLGEPVIGADGHALTFKAVPRIWLDRLVTAVDVGAFDRLTVDEIVLRILTPLPEHAE